MRFIFQNLLPPTTAYERGLTVSALAAVLPIWCPIFRPFLGQKSILTVFRNPPRQNVLKTSTNLVSIRGHPLSTSGGGGGGVVLKIRTNPDKGRGGV